MAVLILNAGLASPITLACQRAGKGAPVFIGEVSRAFAGSERNSVRAQKRTWNVTTGYLDTTTEGNVQAAISGAAQIPCSGDLLGNVTTTCEVRCTTSEMAVGTSLWVMTLVVTEV